MSKTKKQDFALMNILKVNEISRIICETNMGTLKLRIRKGEQDYKFVLDSVELPKELHKEIYELLYAPEIPQVNAANQIILEHRSSNDLGKLVDNGTHTVYIKGIKPAKEIMGIKLSKSKGRSKKVK